MQIKNLELNGSYEHRKENLRNKIISKSSKVVFCIVATTAFIIDIYKFGPVAGISLFTFSIIVSTLASSFIGKPVVKIRRNVKLLDKL